MSTTLPDHDPSSYDDDTEETDRTKQLSWTAPGTYRQHDYLVDIPTNWQSFWTREYSIKHDRCLHDRLLPHSLQALVPLLNPIRLVHNTIKFQPP